MGGVRATRVPDLRKDREGKKGAGIDTGWGTGTVNPRVAGGGVTVVNEFLPLWKHFSICAHEKKILSKGTDKIYTSRIFV